MQAARNYELSALPEVEEIAPSPTEEKELNGMNESIGVKESRMTLSLLLRSLERAPFESVATLELPSVGN
jgi:hypothetical protein